MYLASVRAVLPREVDMPGEVGGAAQAPQPVLTFRARLLNEPAVGSLARSRSRRR